MGTHDPMMEMYLFETNQLLNRLEQLCMDSERKQDITDEIPEIFRIMHTIKGNSMMMLLEDIGKVAHRIEDLFDYLKGVDLSKIYIERIIDYNFEAIDFFKEEISKLEMGAEANGDSKDFVQKIDDFLTEIHGEKKPESNTKPTVENQKYFIAPSNSKTDILFRESIPEYYYIKIFFDDDAQMENVRAFSIVHNLKDLTSEMQYFPSDIVENEETIEYIKAEGFEILFKTSESEAKMHSYFETLAFVKKLDMKELDQGEYQEMLELRLPGEPETIEEVVHEEFIKTAEKMTSKQNFISVDVHKVDKLMDLVGELVVAESMVINNPDLATLKLNNFQKASRQLRLVINEMQDVIMSVRMVPLNMTFQKMSRIVRDMKKKVGKDVNLELIGEETEVDKNVIEKIADPLMHIIRNAMDHGIEDKKTRLSMGKSPEGRIQLSASHVGGDVVISVKDDGKGLDKEAIYYKAYEKGLITKPMEECSDQEIYQLIMHAGFSTKVEVTEFSGRGVGMDVVAKNIESLGGTIQINSEQDKGSEISILIPLTLAIVDGMMMRVGETIFTLPIMAVKESFIVEQSEVIEDSNGQEMVMIRGECYPVIRLLDHYNIESSNELAKGIFVMIEHDDKQVLLYADELIGEQQVVVKSLSKFVKKVKGISGFALLGDGSISMILDPSGFMMA
ncbi:MAG: chemotaxis protein CheA [Clostridia bacterium]|nr:chemotaxis protein CheA [Clostridia bacterium]